MAFKDYYKIIGVSETATAEEIKKAYRKLAKKLHPDATGGDKTKESRFKEISEAYETLGDDKKRRAYDEQRHNPFGATAGPAGQGFPGGFPGGIDLEELRRQVERERAARGGRGGRGRIHVDVGGGDVNPDSWSALFSDLMGGARRAQRAEPAERGSDVVAKLEVDLPQAAIGAETEIGIDGRRLKVKIPAGMTPGQSIRLAGQGHPGARGGPPGDLLIEIIERPHPIFRRREPGSADIDVEMPVPLEVAILGGKAEVRTLEGTPVTLTVPPGTSSGKKLRLRGKGAHTSKDARGDLYANVSIQLPSPTGANAERVRDLLDELAKLSKG